jgi:hypothetical protein
MTVNTPLKLMTIPLLGHECVQIDGKFDRDRDGINRTSTAREDMVSDDTCASCGRTVCWAGARGEPQLRVSSEASTDQERNRNPLGGAVGTF